MRVSHHSRGALLSIRKLAYAPATGPGEPVAQIEYIRSGRTRPSVKSQIQELKQLHRRRESASVISAELQAPGGVISRRKPSTKANRTVVHHSGPSAPNWGGVSYPRFPGVGYPSLPRMVAHMLSPITSPARADALTSASVFAAEAAATVHPPAATSAFSCPDIQPQYPTNTIKLGSCSVDVDQGGRSGGVQWGGGMNDHLRGEKSWTKKRRGVSRMTPRTRLDCAEVADVPEPREDL